MTHRRLKVVRLGGLQATHPKAQPFHIDTVAGSAAAGGAADAQQASGRTAFANYEQGSVPLLFA